MSNELQVPDYLKNVSGGGGDVAAAIASSISIPRLSVRGKVFRFIENGEEIKKVQGSVNVIILGVEPEAGRMIKTFYEKGYQPGNSDPPDCASHDGIRPSAWVTKKQNDLCQTCKWNQFGSATSPNGKPTKKCRDAKQLWILREDDPEGVAGVQYGLNVSVSSLKAFSEFGRKLQMNNLPFGAVITKLSLTDSEYPQLEFDVAGFVKQEDIQQTLKLTQERPWKAVALSLSLAAPADGGGGSTMALPGSTMVVPAHVQAAVGVQDQATPTQPTSPAASNTSVDDVMKNW